MIFRKLPVSLLELLQVGLGFYLAIAATAIFCCWSTPGRVGVAIMLTIGLVIVLILEAIAAFGILWLMRIADRRKEKVSD
jgi:ABC-type Co2+ transport system permease subunit